MKKLYEVTVHTEEQMGFSAENCLRGLEVLDNEDEKTLEEQVRDIYNASYSITITSVDIREVTFRKYNIIVEEKQ